MGSACAEGSLDFAGLLQRLGGGRRLLRLSVELTHRCTFACPHCYCRIDADSPRRFDELSGAEWTRIVNEAAAEGAFFILFTGGEPLLHPDFRTIWVAAKRAGLLPELFTNGSLITADLADFLAQWPPQQVSVTLYGSDEATFATMTGGRSRLAQVLDGLDLLLARGIKVEVKGLFTKGNVHDFERIRALCARYQDTFRWAAELAGSAPESSGRPGDVGLDPAEVIALERQDPARWGEWRRMISTRQPAAGGDGRLFRCHAGVSECHLDPYGRLTSCLMLQTAGYDVRSGSIREGWLRAPELLAGIPWEPGPCQACDLAEVCRICPALSLRLGAPAAGPTDYHCTLGRCRAQEHGLAARPAIQTIQENET